MASSHGWIRGLANVGAVALVLLAGGAEPSVAEDDALAVDSQWRGKLSQGGTHPDTTFPPEVDAVLTVTRRDGNEVEVELRETLPGLDLTFVCRGRVIRQADKSISLEFRSYGLKGVANASIYIIDVPYTARLNGDTLKGAWKFVNKDEGIDLGGDFKLEMMKDEG